MPYSFGLFIFFMSSGRRDGVSVLKSFHRLDLGLRFCIKYNMPWFPIGMGIYIYIKVESSKILYPADVLFLRVGINKM